MDANELLLQWCRFGWAYRGVGKMPGEARDWLAGRVKYETDLIVSKNMSDYFLFVSDAIRWAKDNGVTVGPGRGSSAASVVCWLTRITEVNPYKYQGMMFGRFMDPNRNDPPDIDTDFSDEDIFRVYDYLADKYGTECVGKIGNFIRYRGKNSLQDVARVYNIPIAAKEKVSGLVIERSGGDSRFDASLEDTFEMFADARAILDAYPDFEKAIRLEGNVRGMSVHAAGIVVAGSPLTDICAVYERDETRVLSVDKYDVEQMGALKIDFLGLNTLGMIARCLDMAGLTLEDLYAIPDDDPDTLEVFKKGDVTGVFQFEGRATRLVNRDVSPDHFLHITDINALSRPGPLFSGTTAEYVGVRHGKHKPTRLHPLVDEITKDTYFQIIYQEQILKILQIVGGFDWAHLADIRRIIARKAGEAAFNVNADRFTQGALDLHGIPKETSDKIWKRCVTSGTYAFVIAHAISYSMLAFWTAYLKCKHPLEFYAASLAKASDQDAQFRLMKDALAHGINITPPVLNASQKTWRPVPSLGIVAGWQQIPGIGAKTADRIDDLRWGDGGHKFTSWADLTAIPGIGPVTVTKMHTFATAHDPFGLKRTGEVMSRVLDWLPTQTRGPEPTHNGTQLSVIKMDEVYGAGVRGKYDYRQGQRVIYAGIVKERNYQDWVENERSRSGREVDEIIAHMKRPDLLKYCSLRCYDTTDEEVYCRINRYAYPKLRRIIERITVNHDVIIVVGRRIPGFGTPMSVERMYIVDPD